MQSLTDLEQEILACRKCARLVAWREQVAQQKRRAYLDQPYWGKPVPAFGNEKARLMIIGLAPGAHGSNRTGRMFTGDASGDFLFPALYRAGFASQPTGSHVGDGLTLNDCLISAICRCAPPDNKPTLQEQCTCLPWLGAEINLLEGLQGFVALGKIAFDGILRLYRQQGHIIPALKFTHGAFYQLADGLPWLLASFHPSRQNTQTGRLTATMFDEIWQMAQQKLVR